MPEQSRLASTPRRIGTLGTALALVVLLLPTVSPTLAAPAAELRRYPYLTDVVQNFATVNWATDRTLTSSRVTYGIAGTESCTAHSVSAIRTAITINSVAVYQWKAPLTLQPNTRYCYRVFGGASPGIDLLGTDPSPHFWTQLAAGSAQPYTFAVFGDWGDPGPNGSNPWQANLMSRLAESGVRFALTTGDNAYPHGNQANYGDLIQTGTGLSGVFAAQHWARPGRSIPLFPAIGNHGLSSSSNPHPHLGNWPQDRAVATSNGRYQIDTYCCLNETASANLPSTWYAFDAGIARFYVLHAAWPNGNVGTADVYKNDYDYHWAPGTPQYQWLAADLAAHPSALKFAVLHYPFYSDQGSESSDTYLQGADSLEGLLSAHGVDIAFSGHAHIYQRNQVAHANSLVTYVTGGGGADIQSIGPECSAITMYGRGFSDTSGVGNKCGTGPVPATRDEVFHFLLVSVNGTQVTVTPVDSLGNTFDVVSYEFADEPPLPDTVPPSTPANLRTTSVRASEVRLAWDAATDNVGVTAYDVTRDGVTLATVTAPSTAYVDSSVAASTTYSYAVRARDGAGNASQFSSSLSVTTPPPPLTVIATHDATIRSDAPATNFGSTGRLEADGKPDRDLLVRFDIDGIDGRQVTRATLRLHGVDGSNKGGTFALTSSSWNQATVTWANAPPAQGQALGSIGAVEAGNWYELDVTSVIAADGSVSLRADSASSNGVDYASTEAGAALAPRLIIEVSGEAPPPDTVAPSTPSNLRTTSVSAGSVELAWDAAADNVGVTGYEIRRNGATIATVPAVTQYSDTSVSAEQTYTYEVRARDGAGNWSGWSAPASATTGSAPATLVFGAADDAFIRPDRPTANFGADPLLLVDANSEKDFLVKFVVSGTGGQAVTSAQLRIYCTDSSNNGGEVYAAANTWSESSVTWDTAPALGGAPITTLRAVTANTWYEIDLTSFITGDGTYSLRVSSPSSDGADYTSSEGAGGFHPLLTVTTAGP